MRYDNPEQLATLAGEYVLGTLQGPARRRFERLLLARPDVREQVARWEQRLGPLGSAVAEADASDAPSEAVWAAIRARLPAPATARVVAWRRRPWPLAIGLAAGLLLALNLNTLLAPAGAPATPAGLVTATAPSALTPLADLRATPDRPVWQVARDRAGRRLLITARAAAGQGLSAGSASDWELWALLPQGGVQSLGLVRFRDGQAVLPLDAVQWQALNRATGLGVSREPLGGASAPAPTGPVVYSGAVSG